MATPSESSPSTDHTRAATAALDALLQAFNRSDAPGLVVGVARDGQTLYRRAFGLASLEHGVVNTPRTRMRIGSTSKHFAALATLLLAQDGQLSIDAPLRQYLPELPALGAGPTLRQLMNHTSGWRCHIDLSFIAHGAAIQPRGAALALLARQSELNFESGSRMIYSNGGYHQLTQVIERVSGVRYEEFLTQRILAPLGMHDTASLPSDLDVHAGVASLYLPRPDGGWRHGIFPSEELRAEGAIVSTVDDMLRWLAHLRGADGRLVGSDESWAQMMTPGVLSSGTSTGYGLGLMRHHYRGVEVLHHAGGVVGGTAQMLTLPALRLDLVLMTNGAPVAPVALSFRIVDALLGDALAEPVEERVATTVRPALLGRRYHAPLTGLVIGFSDTAGKLGLSWLNSPPVPLRDAAGGLRLGVEDLPIGPIEIVLPQAPDAPPPATLTVREGGHPHQFMALPDAAPTVAELAAQLVGAYRVPDLDASARLDLEGEALHLRILGSAGRHTLRLEALSSEVLAWCSADPLLSAVVRGVLNVERAGGRVVGLRLDSVRTRHLRLVREEGQP